jgi:hypothetical protein
MFLVVIFLIQIEDNGLKFLALTSVLNLEPLICARKVLEDYENETKGDMNQ